MHGFAHFKWMARARLPAHWKGGTLKVLDTSLDESLIVYLTFRGMHFLIRGPRSANKHFTTTT